MKKRQYTTHTTQSGFTLLFAVLVSTLVVSISATIISIALRQTILSGTSRESQYAFYAANTALDCAHHWDTKNLAELLPPDEVIDSTVTVFPVPGTTDTGIENLSLGDQIICASVNIITNDGGDADYPTDWAQDNASGETTFKLKITDRSGQIDPDNQITGLPPYEYCAEVTVLKTFNNTDFTVTTRIESKGYNTCDPSNPRRVERSLVQEYQS